MSSDTTNKENIRSLELWFRPVFDFSKKNTVGYFSELRINDEKSGVLLPSQFQPVADKSSRGNELSKWAINEGCRIISKHKAKNKDFGFIVLYITEKLICQKSFPSYLETCLKNNKIDGGNLLLSLPVTFLINHFENAFENIKILNSMNVKIMILNYGGEYTTTTNLSLLSGNYVLLDKSLSEGINTDLKVKLVAKSLIDILCNFELNIICEGADSNSVVNEFVNLGCKAFIGERFGNYTKQIRKYKGNL